MATSGSPAAGGFRLAVGSGVVVVDNPTVGADDWPDIADPYRRCEGGCTHDLARGVLVSDLARSDGPEGVPWLTRLPGGVELVSVD